MIEDDTNSNEDSADDQNTDSQKTDGTNATDTKALTKEQIAEFLGSDEGRIALQTEADKRQGTYERRMTAIQRQREASLEQQRSSAETQQLIDSGDLEELGQQTADQVRERALLQQAAGRVSSELETMLLERPDFKVLGEDLLNKIYTDVQKSGGGVIDLMTAIAGAKAQYDVTLALGLAKTDMLTELEARLVEAGLGKRKDTTSTSKDVSSSSPSTTPTNKSDDELLEAFGNGEDVDTAKVAAILRKQGIDVPAGIK